MADSDDEFEPLFDYTRIQPRAPIPVDDDTPIILPVGRRKKQKISHVEVEKKDKKNNVKASVNVINCDDNEEDWLPPPPKIADNSHTTVENSTLKALRLKKQELASFAQSAEEIVRAVEESVRKDRNASLQSSPQSASKQKPLDPPPERPKIVISFQNKNETKPFRVYLDDKFERIFKNYAHKIGVDVNNLLFLWDGDKISPTATPSSLEMEDEDIIEVHIKSR